MHRTTIMLPSPLKIEASRRAQELGMSLGELIRYALEKIVFLDKKRPRETDPLFADTALFTGETPHDLSARHDEYLYGDDA